MSLWCVRNSENLYRSLLRNGLVNPEKSYAVYMIHRNEDTSLFPLNARYGTTSWSNHAFLIIDGFVLDQDFGSVPRIISLEEYLSEMWQSQADHAIFQIRKANQITGYTNLEIRDSIQNQEHLVTNKTGLKKFFSQSPCTTPQNTK